MSLAFNDQQAAALLQLLGLPPDNSDVELILATIADLATDEATEDDGTQPPAAQPPSAIAAAAKRHGLDVVDHDTHEALKRDAAEGRRIAAAAAQAKIEAAVDDAINKGKITPARKKHWVSLIGADPGMADVLAAVPAETAIPLREMGHATDVDVKDLADSSEWFYR
jgi:hypothetical protein